MSDIAISCEGLSKQYRIGERESYKALRDVITDGVASPFRKLRSALRNGNGNSAATSPSALIHLPDTRQPAPDTRHPENNFWALKDVSFEIKRGEVVGIIGRNGAGKSTLLKILSRITKPTRGHAQVHGRVGSLLEVGTGFHPELTGRENIYLNAAILGMRRAEVAKKFDEIMAFAEVEKFIDTPVKRYSSGMYVRLAFAVAAHLETEVLLVDEVLAVGDAQFQKKCLSKIGHVAKEGRTILFVSHNMGAIRKLCRQSILFDKGVILQKGVTANVISGYLDHNAGGICERTWSAREAPGNDLLKLTAARICQPSGVPSANVDITQSFEIEIETQLPQTSAGLTLSLKILTSDGECVLHTADIFADDQATRESGAWVSTCALPAYLLNSGTYTLSIAADIPNIETIFNEEAVVRWSVEPLCSQMALYSPEAWGGFLGPKIAQWNRSRRV
ncbi:MAG TPA: polysaccharide ABC transporter ATP-binding protein [Pyrinomonadaceae bacterium]|nr:polysaccharide ABC transporter ATP-binding protein [Pyrinomonadaceae bacterium]